MTLDASRASQIPTLDAARILGQSKGNIAHHNQTGATQMQPQSVQSDIVNNRGSRVSQHFGQITPPEERLHYTGSSALQQSGDAGKLSREQRARNAANTRHSKSKRAKATDDDVNAREDSDGGARKRERTLSLQREKNRVAAAKCRAKKKAGNEVKESEAREISAAHNFLTREVRELKNEATTLKSQLLAHRPGLCECHGIHHYNAMQARKLVFEAGGHHFSQPIPSPSMESVSSADSAGANALDRPFSAPRRDTLISPKQRTLSGHLESVISPLARSPVLGASLRGGQHISQEFAEFLHSSPGGRPGFS